MSRDDDGAARLSRVERIVGWVVGAPLALVRYLVVTRRTMSETTSEVARLPDAPSVLGESGAGIAVHRRFSLRILDLAISPEQLATIIAADPNLVSPWEVLRWELPPGERRRMRPGDEVLVRMAGPWNGPLRVVARESHRLCLRTCPGHPLRGELELRLREDGGALVAEIDLWERAGSRLVALLHDRLGLTTRMQTHTWVEFLQRTRSVSGGRADGPVRVITEREAAGTGA